MLITDFKQEVKRIYNGQIKWRFFSGYYYAQLTCRQIKYNNDVKSWTVDIYSDGSYICCGFGNSCEEAETDAQRNYIFNQQWNKRLYPPISTEMCNNLEQLRHS